MLMNVQAVAEAAIFHSLFVNEEPFKHGPMPEDEFHGLADTAMDLFDAHAVLATIRECDDAVAEQVIRGVSAIIWAHGVKSAASVALTPH